MHIVCLDLEGVLIPEIWIEFSQRTGIAALSLTTRDEPDYDKLMRYRLETLKHHKLGLVDIQRVIVGMCPLPGARQFLDGLRECFQVAILSDTFYEFAQPFMRQLSWPTLFCHRLEADVNGDVVGYHLRMPDQKRAAVAAFNALHLKTIAVGDSYNDVTMLAEADTGVFFCPPARIMAEFPRFTVTQNYNELRTVILEASTVHSARTVLW
ncbi:MAG TPA: bifunctional phosphoserine phosphatase/homoserine phosphotransferase ThrH [Noviherbaspirillum sp.]|uniref:bifunctional phosphoserine phosphatase/homoserine phosphotransferase ThrH n=1 Tax=Noviherbaspirillum sp. TaxID=1926288 RepID=UPI002B4690D7|nr:bifunctional phosphoserine phosphatase/homoserine phosphotransferase ThrH [Noviherbaspirillum sp.]HJV86511.1 bifunctional phosphoserine phosphatase/homoserine phosphotransferase ThrH [Noviherbaspirillum sp.]